MVCANLWSISYGLLTSFLAMILVLPWYPVSQLQMPLHQKLSICGIFLLGGLVVAAGIARVTAVNEAVTSTSLDHSCEPLYLVPCPGANKIQIDVQCPAFYWAAVEAGVGIISACLPTLRPLMNKKGAESIIRSIQRRVMGSLHSRTQSTEHDESHLKRSRSSDDDSSAASIPVYDGNTGGHRYQANAETAMQTAHIEPPTTGIAVQSSISRQEYMV